MRSETSSKKEKNKVQLPPEKRHLWNNQNVDELRISTDPKRGDFVEASKSLGGAVPFLVAVKRAVFTGGCHEGSIRRNRGWRVRRRLPRAFWNSGFAMWNIRSGLTAAASLALTSARKQASLPRLLPALGCRPSGTTCLGCCRAVHSSSRRSPNELLKKFLVKKKKKFWYSSPTLGSEVLHRQSSLTDALKLQPPKIRKQDSIRKKTLNVLFFQAVRDLLNTPLACQELYDLNVEVFKASLTSDFAICRIYWKSSGNAEKDEYIQQALQRKASYIRHLLTSYRIRVHVPSITFVRDREEEAMREVEKLLAIADMGPEEEENELIQDDFSEEKSIMADIHGEPSVPTDLFGIDHKALNKQIMDYKKMRKKEALEGTLVLETQLAGIRQHQKKMRRKKARKICDDDLNPETYLMERYNKDYWDSEISSSENEELEYKPKEDGNALKKEK
ncbi:putative ribosome-binding factor A, mitochondrial [Erythrolamprus reginae]|uniref:putative ribosome-binding factor A, mitochondrial n=1 Tax=Erythrolamprus reginae TaxID=121349 RepID=UPI00396CF2AD